MLMLIILMRIIDGRSRRKCRKTTKMTKPKYEISTCVIFCNRFEHKRPMNLTSTFYINTVNEKLNQMNMSIKLSLNGTYSQYELTPEQLTKERAKHGLCFFLFKTKNACGWPPIIKPKPNITSQFMVNSEICEHNEKSNSSVIGGSTELNGLCKTELDLEYNEDHSAYWVYYGNIASLSITEKKDNSCQSFDYHEIINAMTHMVLHSIGFTHGKFDLLHDDPQQIMWVYNEYVTDPARWSQMINFTDFPCITTIKYQDTSDAVYYIIFICVLPIVGWCIARKIIMQSYQTVPVTISY